MSLHYSSHYTLIQFKEFSIICDPIDAEDYDPPSDVKFILLSHSTVDCSSGYFNLLTQHPKLQSIPTYSTLPVAKLSQCTTFESLRSKGLLGNVTTAKYTLQQVNNIFNNITTLNYSQSISTPECTITTYNSGYSLGGSIFQISVGDDYKIVYAPKWNHSRDLFLNAGKFKTRRPTSLITNSIYPNSISSHNEQVEKFRKLLIAGLSNRMSFIMPVSITGRLFELLLAVITSNNAILKDVPIYLISWTGKSVLRTAENFIQWMAPSVASLWESQNQSAKSVFGEERIKFLKPGEIGSDGIYFVESEWKEVMVQLIESGKAISVMLTEKTNESELEELFDEWKRNGGKEGNVQVVENKIKWTVKSESKGRGREWGREVEVWKQRMQQLKSQLDILEPESEKEDEEDEDEITDQTITGNENTTKIENGIEIKSDGKVNSESDKGINKDRDVDDESDISDVEKKSNRPITPVENEIKKEKQIDATSFDLHALTNQQLDFYVESLPMKDRKFPQVITALAQDDYGQVLPIKKQKIETPPPETESLPIPVAMVPTVKPIKADPYIDTLACTEPLQQSTNTVKLTLRVAFAYVNLTGLHDDRGLKWVEKDMRPGQVILLGTSKISSNALEVNIPKNDSLELKQERTEWDLELNGDLITKEVSGWQVAQVEGKIKETGKGFVLDVEKSMGSGAKLGDIKLTELLRALKDYKSELLGDGRLVVENCVIVEKVEGGVIIESNGIGEAVSRVRQEVENMLVRL